MALKKSKKDRERKRKEARSVKKDRNTNVRQRKVTREYRERRSKIIVKSRIMIVKKNKGR